MLALFYIITDVFVQVPKINLDTINAVKQALTNVGLNYTIEGRTQFSYEEEIGYIVKYKNTELEGKYVIKGTVLELTIDKENPVFEDMGIVSPNNEEINVNVSENSHTDTSIRNHVNTIIKVPADVANSDNDKAEKNLSVSVNSWNYVDSFTKSYTSVYLPGKSLYVDYGKGIAGTFSFSRELTEYEKNSWGHTGKLYDSEGNNMRELGYKTSYWSIPEGEFAIELPTNLPPGEYTYELIQVVGDSWLTSSITFMY